MNHRLNSLWKENSLVQNESKKNLRNKGKYHHHAENRASLRRFGDYKYS